MNRKYDQYLRPLLDMIKDLNKYDKEMILIYIKDVLMELDPELIDQHVKDFPLSMKRRWYDQDPYSWLVINSLKYLNEKNIIKISDLLKQKLDSLNNQYN